MSKKNKKTLNPEENKQSADIVKSDKPVVSDEPVKSDEPVEADEPVVSNDPVEADEQFYIAKRKSVTSKRGILSDGDVIRADDLQSGLEGIIALVKSGHVIKG